MKTTKGQAQGLSGEKYEIESVNVKPGRAPDTMWMGIGGKREGMALIALVGFEEQVMKFARRAGRDVPQPVALCKLDIPIPEGPPRLALTLAGFWPEDRARAVVQQLTGGGSNGWRRWAREFIKLRSDPHRVDPGHPDEGLTKELVYMFLQQCSRVTCSPKEHLREYEQWRRLDLAKARKCEGT